MAAPLAIDPTRCPLCGADNRCAVELARITGEAQPRCWCMDAHFTPSLRATIPEAARGKACLCAQCVRQAMATVKEETP